MVKNDFRKTSIPLGFLRKVFSFVKKHPQFYPKKYLFIVCIFYLTEGELIHQVCLKKYEAFSRGCIFLILEMLSFLRIIFKLFLE